MREVLRWSLKALLCGRGDEWRRFDALFDAYFLPPEQEGLRGQRAAATTGAAARRRRDWATRAPATDRRRGAGTRRATTAMRERHGASREESLASTDFRDLDRADHVRDIEALMRRFARRLKHLRLRREARVDHGRRLDLPGTIRRSVGSGGTPFRLAWKDRRRVRPRLVLLLDVSRSMSLYSFFYLRLARALCAELADVHCFIFHTRITGVARSAARPRSVALAGAAAPARRGLGRRHAHRRVPAGLQPRPRAAPRAFAHGGDHRQRRLRHRRAGAAGATALARCAAGRGASSGSIRCCDRPGFHARRAAACRRRCRTSTCFAPGADLASIEHMLPDLIEALR